MINVILFTFFIVLLLAYMPLENERQKKALIFCISICLICIAAFRGEGVDRDYQNYLEMFQQNYEFIIEPSFVLVVTFVKSVFGNQPVYLFIIFAILGISLKITAIRQLTELEFLSVCIYFCNFFLLHDMTQIRAGIASGFLLLCIKPIYDRNLKKFLLFSLISVSFHFSSLLIFLLWFLRVTPRKKLLLFSIPFGYAVYFTHINLIASIPFFGIGEKIEAYKNLQELGGENTSINVFNMLFLFRICVFYFLLYKYDLLASKNKYFPILIKVFCISLVSLLVFATMPVAAFRLNELFGIVEIILIPFLYYVFKPAPFAKAIITCIAVLYIFTVLFYNKLLLS